jgi:diguanylate cyclase (GGDEF)-like protein
MSDASAASAGLQPPAPAAREARPKLLIVDDQPINIRFLHEIFQADHDVFVATSGADALAFCAGNLPDLILADVIMPHMDGYDLCRKLKQDEHTHEIPVIFVTAQSDTPDEEEGLEAGAVDFISKSASPRVIRARVKTHLTLKHQTDLLRSLSLIDSLTGIANRRNFDETLRAEWRHCARESKSLSLLMIDIDFFKRYNDEYGHQAGDTCLRAVATCIKSCMTRPHDLAARYGGEEFVCVLPDTPHEGGLAKAQSLLAAVRALAIPHAASDVPGGLVSISIGLASVTPHHEHIMENLTLAADQALYRAKQDGRGRIKSTQFEQG